MRKDPIARRLASDTGSATLDEVAPPPERHEAYGSAVPLSGIISGTPEAKVVGSALRAARLPLFSIFIDALMVESGLARGQLDPRWLRAVEDEHHAKYPASWAGRDYCAEQLARGRADGLLQRALELCWEGLVAKIPDSAYAEHWRRLDELTRCSAQISSLPSERDIFTGGHLDAHTSMLRGIATVTSTSAALLVSLPGMTVVDGTGKTVPIESIEPFESIARGNRHIVKRLAAIRVEDTNWVNGALRDETRDHAPFKDGALVASIVNGRVRLDFSRPLKDIIAANPFRPSEPHYPLVRCPALSALDGEAAAQFQGAAGPAPPTPSPSHGGPTHQPISARRRASASPPAAAAEPEVRSAADNLIDAAFSAMVRVAGTTGWFDVDGALPIGPATVARGADRLAKARTSPVRATF